MAWFKKGSGTVVRSTLRAVPATVPDPFLNHARFSTSRGFDAVGPSGDRRAADRDHTSSRYTPMKRHLAFVVVLSLVASVGVATAETNWVFSPSYYSHEPLSGQRVAQFAPAESRQVRVDPTYMESGYRHNRSTIRGAGGSADRFHVVQTWGAGESIRPYGEWQRPFREGATPYGPWGNPQGPWTSPFGSWVNPYGLGNLPWGGYHAGSYPPFAGYPGGPGMGGPGMGGPGMGGPGMGGPGMGGPGPGGGHPGP